MGYVMRDDENYPTFAIRLWAENTEGILDDINEFITTAPSLYALGKWLQRYFESLTEDDVKGGLSQDLFNYALGMVNWFSLASDFQSSYIEDVMFRDDTE